MKKPKVKVPKIKLDKCPECKAKAGEIHQHNCDIERCSVCGGQLLTCHCDGHDKQFARWTGFWRGELECKALNMDLNTFYMTGMHRIFFVKPK